MTRLVISLLFILLANTAQAHSLRLFAKVDDSQVTGYAFFIGGGRPADVKWVAKMNDKEIASGKTNAKGGYNFKVPESVVGDIVITVDTEEGHIATTRLALDRFGPISSQTPARVQKEKKPPITVTKLPPERFNKAGPTISGQAPVSLQGGGSPSTTTTKPVPEHPGRTGPTNSQTPTRAPGEEMPSSPVVPSSEATSRMVEDAVQRQVGPLLERIEVMDARMRFTDVMSGVFLIIGLAGIGLWARSRKR